MADYKGKTTSKNIDYHQNDLVVEISSNILSGSCFSVLRKQATVNRLTLRKPDEYGGGACG